MTCQFCDRPFARGGHAVSVMWAGCSGRHLGEARPVKNLDRGALRLAQFFDKLCRANHHIYIDTAAAVIEQKLINNPAANLVPQEELVDVTGFQHYIQRCRLNDPCMLWRYYALSTELIKIAVSLYEDFDDFLDDCQQLEPDAPGISQFWDTYCVYSSTTQNFVREIYELGVAEWSWPAFEHLNDSPSLKKPFPSISRPEGELCCTPSDTYLPHFDYQDPHPGVRSLTSTQMVAMTEMMTSS
jgi:hypothetical protein